MRVSSLGPLSADRLASLRSPTFSLRPTSSGCQPVCPPDRRILSENPRPPPVLAACSPETQPVWLEYDDDSRFMASPSPLPGASASPEPPSDGLFRRRPFSLVVRAQFTTTR